MKLRVRFTLRFVLLTVLVVACLLALWRARPAPTALITLEADGTVHLDGDELDRADLPSTLDHESARRSRWWVEPQLRVQVDPAVLSGDVVKIVEMARQAGFERVSLAARPIVRAKALKD